MVLESMPQRDGVISLFPLIEDDELKTIITKHFQTNSAIQIESIDSAGLVDREVTGFAGLAEWSFDLGMHKVEGKALRELLHISHSPISSWWFGHFSERNPLKTTAFLKLAQVAAIRKLLASKKYDKLVVVVSDLVLRQSLTILAEESQLEIITLHLRVNKSLKSKLLELISSYGALGQILRSSYTWAFYLKRALIARISMRGVRRDPGGKAAPLIISYFAALDKGPIEGKFYNKYYRPLQDLIEMDGGEIAWLLMYVPIYNHSFRDACLLARNFANNGENVSLIEEHLTLPGAFLVIAQWIRTAVKAVCTYPKIDKSALYPKSLGKAAEPILKALWRDSFYGSVAMEGWLFLKMFENYFKINNNTKDIIYFFENHPWEKILLSTGRQQLTKSRFIGYQHTTVPRNLFPYFCSPKDTEPSAYLDSMPLPDHLVANGKLTKSLLMESGFPGLIEAEAIRYFYVEKILTDKSLEKSKHPTLLIAGSIDKVEMISVMKFVKSKISSLEKYEVWIKGHPNLPMALILKEVGIDPLPDNWLILSQDISIILPSAWCVIVPASTVAVEAIACGCEVIVPVFPDALTLNPLQGFEEYYQRVHNGPQFVAALNKIISEGCSEIKYNNYKEFIRQYWNLDVSMRGWSDLISVNATNVLLP